MPPFLDSLLKVLQDIAQNVHIDVDGSVSHPLHGQVQPEWSDDRFQQLPPVLRQRYINLQLRNFLYSIYFSGTLPNAPVRPESAPILENNRAWGLNLDFYGALHESNLGQGFFDPGWCIVGQDEDGLVGVEKQALTLHVAPAVLGLLGHEAAILEGSTEQRWEAIAERYPQGVAVKMPRNRLQCGWYIAIGDAGMVEPEAPQVNIFLNLAASDAAAVMRHITQRLNRQGIPFTFKLPYDPENYDRRDAATLSFAKSYAPEVWQTLSALATPLRPEIPFCTQFLAPGIAFAEAPEPKFSASEDFGTHRCQLIANGLLVAEQQGEKNPDFRQIAILNQFYDAALELEYAYLNAGSEDIYANILSR